MKLTKNLRKVLIKGYKEMAADSVKIAKEWGAADYEALELYEKWLEKYSD